MHKPFQKKKRALKRSFKVFRERVHFIIKLGLSLLVLFFVVLLGIIKPYESEENLNFFEEQVSSLFSGDAHKKEFVEEIAPVAKKAQKEYGTRPSVLIAQAALESNWGESTLAKEANNYFGIKAANEEKTYATREFRHDEWVNIDASFKFYDSMEDSVMDYAKLMKDGTSWDSDLYHKVIDADSYKEAAAAVQEAGYATDPDYATKIVQIIEQYGLDELDN